MATEAYIQESVCLQKGEREENALPSENFEEKVTELPGNQVKQLETSSQVAETVNTPLEAGKPTDESGSFFQALSVPMVIADEYSNTPESWKAAKQTDTEVKTIKIEEKAIESDEVCEEVAPVKAETEVGLNFPDSVTSSKNAALDMLVEKQVDSDGVVTSSKDAASEGTKGTTEEHATTVADFKERDLSETAREFVKEATDDKSVDAQEAYEQCEIRSKDIEGQKAEESVKKIEQDEEIEEIKPVVEMEKREQTGLLQAITTDACISTQTISQEETTKHEEKEPDVNVLEKDQDDVTRAQEVTFDGGLQEKIHHNENNEHEVAKAEGTDVCILSQTALVKESIQNEELDDEKAIELPSQQETISTIEKDQGDSGGVTNSQEPPCMDVEEKTTVQQVTTATDFKEQDLNEKPREFIKEETEDKPLDAQRGAKEEIDQMPEESVKKIEKEEETEEIKPGVEIEEKKEQNEFLPAITTDVCITTQTKSQVESIEKDTEAIRSSEKTEQQMLINVIPSDVCISTQTEPEEETAELNDEAAIEGDDGRTNRSEEGLLLSDRSSMALNENETVRKDEDQEKEQEVYVSENASNEQEQHTEEIKPSVETSEEKDVCISTHIEYQEMATKNEENDIKNDGDQKEKSDNPFVNEVCEENDLTKTESEEEVKLSDSSNVTTREGVEATEETKSSDETKENMEQEGVLNVITTDVCSSTQTEYKEKTTETKENYNEETVDKDDSQTEKPESLSEEVKHSDSSTTLNENETLSREENLEEEDEIKTSEVQGGRDDVISSQIASSKDIKEMTGQQDTNVAYVEEGQGEIAMPKEILIEEADDKTLEAEEHGKPNERNVEETQPCVSKTISENPEDDIKKEDEDLSHESMEDTNEDSSKEGKCTLEQQAIEDHNDRDEVSKEKFIDLIETTKVEPQEEITPSTLVETSTEDAINSEKEIAESENLPTKDLETVSEKTEVQGDGDDVTSSQNASNEDIQETTIGHTTMTCDKEGQGVSATPKEILTEEAQEKSCDEEEKTEQTTEIKQETVKELCEDTSSKKDGLEGLKLFDTSTMKINEKEITFINDDEGKDEEVSMSIESQGLDNITSSHIEAFKEKVGLKENNYHNEGNEGDFIESEEGVDKDTEEIKSSIDTEENTEHAIANIVCSSTQIEIHEETKENEEKNGEKAIEYDEYETISREENLETKQDDVEETKMVEHATTVASFEEGQSLDTVTKELFGKEEQEGEKSDIAQEETEQYNDGDKSEQKPEEDTDDIKPSVETNEEKDVCITTQNESQEEATKNKENAIERDGDRQEKLDNPSVKEACEDLTTTESEEKQLSGSYVKTREVVDEDTEEIKSSDETKENMEQHGVLNDITTDICSSTQTENIEKPTVKEEKKDVETTKNDNAQIEKPESPLVEVLYEATRSEIIESEEGSDSFSTTLNENETLSKDNKLEKEDEIKRSEVQGGGDEVTSAQNASNEDVKETTGDESNTTVAFVEEGQRVSALPKEILIEESKEKSVNVEEMLVELGQPNEQNVEETHPCVSKTLMEEEKCTLEHEPVEEHSGRDSNETTVVVPQEDIAPSTSLERSTKDTSNSEKEKAESKNLAKEDLETVSDVQIPKLVPKSEEPMLKGRCFISETETHLDEEKETRMEEILSDEKIEKTTEIKQETVKEVCEETSSEKAEFEEELKIYDSSHMKINEEITTLKDDDQERDHEVNMSTESQGNDKVTSSENEAFEEKEDLQEKNYHNEGNEGDFIEIGDTLEINSSVETKENTGHVITPGSSTEIEHDEESIENEEKNDQNSIENDANEIVSREENLEKQENAKETDTNDHATTLAYFEEGHSLSTVTKEVLGEIEEEDKAGIAQEKTEQYDDGDNNEREQKPEQHTDEIKPSVEAKEEKDVCISTQNQCLEEPTKNEENAIENLETPFVKEACEATDLTKTESEVRAKHPDSFSTELKENETLSKEEKLEKEDNINTLEVQGGGDEATSSQNESKATSSQNESNDDIKETIVGGHYTTMAYVEEGRGVSTMPKEILKEEAEDKSIDAKEISLELGQPSEQKVETHPSLSKSISENPEDEIKKENKDLSHESVEGTNDNTTKEENCTLEHELIEKHSDQDEVSEEKVTDSTEIIEAEPQEDITPSISLETSAEDTSNSDKEKAKVENLPIENTETVSEVLIHELVPKSEVSVLKEECFISEMETHLEEEKGTPTEELSSDEKTEQITEIKQETVKEVCKETSSEKAEFEERMKPSDTSSSTEINERGMVTFKVDDQEKDHKVNMSAESQGKVNVTSSHNEASKAKEDLQERYDRNEGKEGDFLGSGEGVEEDTEEIKSRLETEEYTEHVITTNVCRSAQIEPNEETSQKNGEKEIENDENEIICGEENLKKGSEDVCSSAQAEHKAETIENKETIVEAIDNDDGQMNLENHENEQEPEVAELQGGGDDVACSQNASSGDTKETMIGQLPTTTVHFEEGVCVNAITKEIMGEEVENKLVNAQKASEQCDDEAKDRKERQPVESVNKPVNSCSEAIEGSIKEEADAGNNKEIKSKLKAETQAEKTEDKTDMKDEAVLTERVSNEYGQNKEQNSEAIEACLTETISEKTEDKITKDEDLSHDSIQHVNENITKEEKCFPDVIKKEIENSALEHKPTEEQNDSQDEVSNDTFTYLNETTALETQEDITPSSSLETSAEDTSKSDKEKTVSENLPKEDLEFVSEVHIPEVMPKSEDLRTKEECLISATTTYVDEELGTVTKEISSDKNLETHGSTQQPEHSYSTTEENVTQLEQISGVNSQYEIRDTEDDFTQNTQLNSNEDCSEMEKSVILTEEIEQMPLETEKEKGIDEFKEQIVDKDSYSLEFDEKSAQNQKELVHEISNSESIPAENPKVKEVNVDDHIGQQDSQDKEDISCVTKVTNDKVDEEPKEDDATVESVDMSNIESTAYPSSEKLATHALKSDCNVQIPEAIADLEDSKVKEDCIVLATTDENNVEEQDTNFNEISSAPDKEQEIVTKAPTKSDEAKNSDLTVEEKALTKENLEVHEELAPTSEPVIEEYQVTVETKQSDITFKNITNDQTLESKLEHASVKDLEDRKGNLEEVVALPPENETKSIENLNEITKNIILTDEVDVETEKEKERDGVEGQISEEGNCPKEVDSTSTPNQNELANEIEYSKESQIEVENIQAAEDLSYLSKASSNIESSKVKMDEDTEQTITVIKEAKDDSIDVASKDTIVPALEDSKASELEVNLPEKESTDTPSNGQIQRSYSKLETKELVEDTEDAKFSADNLSVEDERFTVIKGPNENSEIVASAFQSLEDMVTNKKKETLDEPQADDSEKPTYDSILSSTEQDIAFRSEESGGHGDTLKLEEKPTGDSEIATEVVEIVPKCKEASAILSENLPVASPDMLLVEHEEKITEDPEVLSPEEKDDVGVQKHEKDLDLNTKEATTEVNNQENQKAQKKTVDESKEAVKTSTRELEVGSLDLEVPSIVDATNDNAMNKTVEVHDTRGLLKDDEHLESTCDQSKPIEEGSGITQKPLELDAATEDSNIYQKYVTDDLVKVSQTSPEIQKYEVSACTVDKQSPSEPHPKESNESKILTEKRESAHEQGELVAKSLNPEAANLEAKTASGTEPHSNTVFIDQRKSESVEPAKTVLHEPAKGNAEVAGSLIGEKDSALIKDQQVEKEETGVKTDDEDEEEEEDNEDDEKMGSCSDAPVMVEASKDMEVKAHKKSHNILSGVGSKVKHSIAKVKKAITGKSSPPKPPSPKAKNQVTG